MAYDLVTFDIFDTLVHRRVRAPVDIFEAVRLAALQDQRALLNHDRLAAFGLQRIQAESDARKERSAKRGGEGEVTLDEIYMKYQELSKCDAPFRDFMKETELRLERLFLFASERGLQKYNELRAKARNVAFISDMYLPSDWLLETLERLGFEGATSCPIFVSGELRNSKHTGALYEVVRKQLGVRESDRWLHVGDNRHADVGNARAAGIEALHADWSAVDNRRLSGANSRDYLVRSIVEFIQQPQALSFMPEDPYARIGYRTFGPIIFGYLLWIMAITKDLGLRRLVFIARDGWLPLKLFEGLKSDVGLGNIEVSYVYFSRQTGLQSGIKSWDIDRNWPLHGRVKRRIEDVLGSVGLDSSGMSHVLERLGLSRGDLVTSDNWRAAHKLLSDSFTAILTHSQRKREDFKKYVDRYVSPEEETGLVDIGWNGNIQRTLIDSLDSRFSKEQFVGLFLGLHASASVNRDRGLRMQGWLSDFGQPGHVEEYLLSGGVELLEFALTADHGTTLGFAKTSEGAVEPVLEEAQSEESEYRERAIRVQGGIQKFVEDFRFLVGEFEPALICSTAWSQPFERLVVKPTMEEISLLANLSHSDSIGSTDTRAPLAAREGLLTRWLPGRRSRARGSAFWKSAFDRLNG